MRDDRYKGTAFSRAVKRLCRMSEREADRCKPERMRAQAVEALAGEARRELSPDFKQHLVSWKSAPSLFGAGELMAHARSSLEVQVVQNFLHGAKDSPEALGMALRDRGAAFAREQKCQLIADGERCATAAPESVEKACNAAAVDAAAIILSGERVPANLNKVQLTEDLLVPGLSGAAP